MMMRMSEPIIQGLEGREALPVGMVVGSASQELLEAHCRSIFNAVCKCLYTYILGTINKNLREKSFRIKKKRFIDLDLVLSRG